MITQGELSIRIEPQQHDSLPTTWFGLSKDISENQNGWKKPITRLCNHTREILDVDWRNFCAGLGHVVRLLRFCALGSEIEFPWLEGGCRSRVAKSPPTIMRLPETAMLIEIGHPPNLSNSSASDNAIEIKSNFLESVEEGDSRRLGNPPPNLHSY